MQNTEIKARSVIGGSKLLQIKAEQKHSLAVPSYSIIWALFYNLLVCNSLSRSFFDFKE